MGNAKTIYKYTHDGEVGYMHYIMLDGKQIALSVFDSLKVRYKLKNGKLDVTTDLKDGNFKEKKCNIDSNKEFVQKVYELMLESNNSYFKNGTDGLCAIVFEE